MFSSLLQMGHWDNWDRERVDFLTKTLTGTDPWGLCENLFILLSDYVISMIMTS